MDSLISSLGKSQKEGQEDQEQPKRLKHVLKNLLK